MAREQATVIFWDKNQIQFSPPASLGDPSMKPTSEDVTCKR